MNIFFDHQIFSRQNYGGIPRYICELINGINQPSSPHLAYLSVLFSNNVHLREGGFPALPFFPKQPFARTQPHLYRINRLFTLLELRARSYDLFHATYYDPYFLGHIGRKPYVVTVHDLIHERLSARFEGLKADHKIIPWKKEILSRAAGIIAVSESTRRDLAECYGIPPERVRVVHLGSSLGVSETGPEVEHPYLLFVGNRGAYKNFLPWLEAVAPLLPSFGMQVVCAGGGGFTPEEQETIRRLHLTDRVRQQPIDDAGLVGLYRGAGALVFPSLYEGFGIPVLEAFACGCPCLLSDRSSLPEVAGPAAVYFNPDDAASMKAATERILSDASLRRDLAETGRNRLRQFSWEKTVRETVALYESLV
ncbi:glycosyltransferase family 4 protein [Larkinella soli]|uniref:glycosyltransferase family 4 protein n=1 Tax=Larkinella soli TaxID=1770527 RepID=UPI0013E2DEE6|nr:glycosyltransferase family 1 protein [Larkinella soli]